MQLSDVLEDTDAIEEAILETSFQARLKKLSRLPKWKKEEELERLINQEFGFEDVIRIVETWER
jgi:hypothetical protein